MKEVNNILTTFLTVLLVTLNVKCSAAQGFKEENPSTLNSAEVNSADGSSIHYGVSGQGKVTLVFIHCWTCKHKFWDSQIKYFSKKHRVVWLDLAGHGASSSNRRAYTMSAFGKDVAAVVNAIGGENIILVGHSMGGPVAIEAANLLGNRVIGIVGVDTFYTPFEYPKTEAEIDEFKKPFKDDFKGTSEQMVRSMFTPEADPDLISSIENQLSVANQDMAISAMYEIFEWNTRNVPSVLSKYSKILHN